MAMVGNGATQLFAAISKPGNQDPACRLK